MVSRLRATLGQDIIDGNRDGYRIGYRIGTVHIDLCEAADLLAEAQSRLADAPVLAATAAGRAPVAETPFNLVYEARP